MEDRRWNTHMKAQRRDEKCLLLSSDHSKDYVA